MQNAGLLVGAILVGGAAWAGSQGRLGEREPPRWIEKKMRPLRLRFRRALPDDFEFFGKKNCPEADKAVLSMMRFWEDFKGVMDTRDRDELAFEIMDFDSEFQRQCGD